MDNFYRHLTSAQIKEVHAGEYDFDSPSAVDMTELYKVIYLDVKNSFYQPENVFLHQCF